MFNNAIVTQTRRIIPATCIALALSVGHGTAADILSATTASPGGTPFLSITHLAEVASAEGIAELQVTSGQVATTALMDVAQGNVDVSWAPMIMISMMAAGRGPFSNLGEDGTDLAANLRALYPYSNGAMVLFALGSSGVSSFDDLGGRTIYNGPPSGGAVNIARNIVQVVTGMREGSDYTGLQVGWDKSNQTIVDGSADAMLLPSVFPSDRVTVAASSGKVNVISVPKEVYEGDVFQRLASSPGLAPFELPAANMALGEDAALMSEDSIFRSVGVTNAEVVHMDMPFETAKALTAAYIASMDALQAKAPWAANINIGVLDPTLSGFCGQVPLLYHPGAIAAWEEAGYDVPDCAQP